VKAPLQHGSKRLPGVLHSVAVGVCKGICYHCARKTTSFVRPSAAKVRLPVDFGLPYQNERGRWWVPVTVYARRRRGRSAKLAGACARYA